MPKYPFLPLSLRIANLKNAWPGIYPLSISKDYSNFQCTIDFPLAQVNRRNKKNTLLFRNYFPRWCSLLTFSFLNMRAVQWIIRCEYSRNKCNITESSLELCDMWDIFTIKKSIVLTTNSVVLQDRIAVTESPSYQTKYPIFFHQLWSL